MCARKQTTTNEAQNNAAARRRTTKRARANTYDYIKAGGAAPPCATPHCRWYGLVEGPSCAANAQPEIQGPTRRSDEQLSQQNQPQANYTFAATFEQRIGREFVRPLAHNEALPHNWPLGEDTMPSQRKLSHEEAAAPHAPTIAQAAKLGGAANTTGQLEPNCNSRTPTHAHTDTCTHAHAQTQTQQARHT